MKKIVILFIIIFIISYGIPYKELPIIKLFCVDEVSNGSGSFNTHTYIFKEPDRISHYKFLYWEVNGNIYNAGSRYIYKYNNINEVYAHAIWQSSVIINYYDDNELIHTIEDYKPILIDYTITKIGYDFMGWYDDNNKKIDIVSPYKYSSERIEPRVINLYSKWNKIIEELEITRIIGNDEIKEEEIAFNLYKNNILIGTYNITKDDNWKLYLIVDKYDENGNEIEYSANDILTNDSTKFIIKTRQV